MLRSLGIEKIFSPGADFGNITKADAMVSKAIQDTMLKLDPNGAEGAAYTMCQRVARPNLCQNP